MKTMIKMSTGWSVSKVLMVAIFAFTLTACGGGGSSNQTLLQQVQALVATGNAADLEAANDLVLNNQDNVSAAEFEALMDALAAA
ncbi:MAG: hypothetical protein HOP25_00610 [Methylotenera sp.]|nr:hypothetical protein [Methylotenera sp.]